MTESTKARLEQIIALSRRADTHACGLIRQLAERALADERHTMPTDPDPDIRALMEKYWALSHDPTTETQAFLEARGAMVWYDIGLLSGYILKLEARIQELAALASPTWPREKGTS